MNKKELNDNEVENVSGGINNRLKIRKIWNYKPKMLMSYGGPKCFDKKIEISTKKDEENSKDETKTGELDL